MGQGTSYSHVIRCPFFDNLIFRRKLDKINIHKEKIGKIRYEIWRNGETSLRGKNRYRDSNKPSLPEKYNMSLTIFLQGF